MRLVSVSDKESSLFPGVKAEDVLKSKEVQNRVQSAVRQLVKFNTWMEALVEVRKEGLVVRGTVINEY